MHTQGFSREARSHTEMSSRILSQVSGGSLTNGICKHFPNPSKESEQNSRMQLQKSIKDAGNEYREEVQSGLTSSKCLGARRLKTVSSPEFRYTYPHAQELRIWEYSENMAKHPPVVMFLVTGPSLACHSIKFACYTYLKRKQVMHMICKSSSSSDFHALSSVFVSFFDIFI